MCRRIAGMVKRENFLNIDIILETIPFISIEKIVTPSVQTLDNVNFIQDK